MTFEVTSGVVKTPKKILLYGTAGIGKTFLCSQIPNTLFLDLETGSLNFDVKRISTVKKAEEFYDFVKWFVTQDYGTLVIDSMTKLEQLLTRLVLDQNGWPNLEKPGYGKGHEILKQEYMRVLSAIDFIISRGKNVVTIGHVRTKTFTDPTTEQYDRYEPDVQKNVLPVIVSQMDAVLFYKWKTLAVEAEKGERFIARGSGDREIYIQERPAFIAKSRMNLPHTVINPQKEFWDACFNS